MDTNNALMTYENTVVSELTAPTGSSYCSMKAETPQEKAKLFAAMNNPEFRIADKINETIQAKDIFVEVVTVKNPETDEDTQAPRLVIIDKDGHGYQAVSLGLYSALKKLIAIFGAPTWETPLPLKIRQVKKGKNSLLTFDVDMK